MSSTSVCGCVVNSVPSTAVPSEKSCEGRPGYEARCVVNSVTAVPSVHTSPDSSLRVLSLSPQKALGFLSKDCSLVHRGICLSSVFVDGAGEWKLGGVEWMHAHGDSPVPPKTLELLQRYDPPEIGKPAAAKRVEKW